MSKFLHKPIALNRFLIKFKQERKQKMPELDVEFFKALESGDTDKQQLIASQKNTLRDFPTTITTDSFSTLDELRALWPTDILDLPNSWR